MELDLFSGLAVTDYARGVAWVEGLLGSPAEFEAHDTECVWTLAEHRHLCVVLKPEHAGKADNPSAARGLRWRWHDLTGDQHSRRSAAPSRPRPPAPRPRPNGPRVRAAAGRRGARPRCAHVGRAPQPRVPARVRRVAVLLPDDASHRAGHVFAASRRPQRHRGLLRGRLLVAGHLQHPLQRAGRCAAERLPARGCARDRRHAALRGEAGVETDQESRSVCATAPTSVAA